MVDDAMARAFPTNQCSNLASEAGSSLCLRNRQRACAVDLRLFRKIILVLLNELAAVTSFQIGVCLVETTEITRLNEQFLRHAGSTDVITFNYCPRRRRTVIHGDIFICASEAVKQSRRFRTTWQTELVRYLVHGLLHLQGYDDLTPPARRKMKLEEGRRVRELGRRFELRRLGKRSNWKR